MWPRRDSICLACRSLRPAGIACTHGTHQMRALGDPRQRADLVVEVRGSLRRRVSEAGAVGATAGGLGTVLDGCASLINLDGWYPLLIAVALGLIWLIARVVIDLVRGLRDTRNVRGAQRAVDLGLPTRRIGTVIGPHVARDPLAHVACVAFGIALAYRDRVMLRDGATLGFELALTTGERVLVPAGPCVVDMTGAAPIGNSAVDGYLASVDPRRTPGARDPFPHDRARLVAIRPGDTVELLSPVAPAPDARAAGGYRDPAAILVPDGIVQLRRADLV
jgi:hypothetical protein